MVEMMEFFFHRTEEIVTFDTNALCLDIFYKSLYPNDNGFCQCPTNNYGVSEVSYGAVSKVSHHNHKDISHNFTLESRSERGTHHLCDFDFIR